MNIEKASANDFEEITAVWEASVRATHYFLSEADILFYKPLILHQYLYVVNVFCIRNNEGEIEGFMATSWDKLEMLFLKPTARGKGIGKLLLNYAIENLHIRKVDVNEQNYHAVGFYEHAGFKVISRASLDGNGKPYPVLSMELKE